MHAASKPDIFGRAGAKAGRAASAARPRRIEVGVATTLPRILIRSLPAQRARGNLIAATTVIPCAFGPAGIVRDKREGDGATPAGSFLLKRLLVRPDRLPRPLTALSIRPIRIDGGWCDDPASALYNRPVRRPFAGGHEALWRADGLYDCVGVLDYNTDRIRKGRGSAIFLHVATPEFRPTAGCIAIRRADLLRLLRRIGPATRFVIG